MKFLITLTLATALQSTIALSSWAGGTVYTGVAKKSVALDRWEPCEEGSYLGQRAYEEANRRAELKCKKSFNRYCMPLGFDFETVNVHPGFYYCQATVYVEGLK